MPFEFLLQPTLGNPRIRGPPPSVELDSGSPPSGVRRRLSDESRRCQGHNPWAPRRPFSISVGTWCCARLRRPGSLLHQLRWLLLQLSQLHELQLVELAKLLLVELQL